MNKNIFFSSVFNRSYVKEKCTTYICPTECAPWIEFWAMNFLGTSNSSDRTNWKNDLAHFFFKLVLYSLFDCPSLQNGVVNLLPKHGIDLSFYHFTFFIVIDWHRRMKRAIFLFVLFVYQIGCMKRFLKVNTLNTTELFSTQFTFTDSNCKHNHPHTETDCMHTAH